VVVDFGVLNDAALRLLRDVVYSACWQQWLLVLIAVVVARIFTHGLAGVREGTRPQCLIGPSARPCCTRSLEWPYDERKWPHEWTRAIL